VVTTLHLPLCPHLGRRVSSSGIKDHALELAAFSATRKDAFIVVGRIVVTSSYSSTLAAFASMVSCMAELYSVTSA
jgi:hypothetical protein